MYYTDADLVYSCGAQVFSRAGRQLISNLQKSLPRKVVRSCALHG